MSTLRRFVRVQSLLAVASIVIGLLAASPSAHAANGQRLKISPPESAGGKAAAGLHMVETDALLTQGAPQLVVQSDHWDGNVAKLSHISGESNEKFAYGTRITIPAEDTPFTLSGIIALTLEFKTAGGNPAGLQVGDPIEFLVFSDAGASGDLAAAKLVYRQTGTFKTLSPETPSLDDVLYQLTTPVTVKQGDLYIMMADRTTRHNTGTVIPYLPLENGGTSFALSTMNRASAALDLGSYTTLNNNFRSDSVPIPPHGEFVTRAVGHVAEADAPITATLEVVNDDLAAPTNLAGVSTGAGGTLRWTAPTLPRLATVTEVESNNTPATAQRIQLDSELTASAQPRDPGTPLGDIGFGGTAQDWYRFTVMTATRFTAALVVDVDSDFDLYLFGANDPTGPAVAFSAAGCGFRETIGVPSLAPGDYYLAVVAFPNGECPFDASTTYKIDITAQNKLYGYNVYCGAGTITPSATTYFGSTGPASTSFPIGKSSPGLVYVVTAIIGDKQSGPSNLAPLSECTGGPSVTSATIKLAGNGKIAIRGSGFVVGSTILLNGSAIAATYKVKKNGTIIKGTGPLANGAPYSSVVVSGQQYTLTLVTPSGGCSSFTMTAP